MTFNLKNPQITDLHSSICDFAAISFSLFIHLMCLVLDLANKDFSAFDDSKILQSGFLFSRFATLLNCMIIPIFGFANRKSVAFIIFHLHSVDVTVNVNTIF